MPPQVLLAAGGRRAPVGAGNGTREWPHPRVGPLHWWVPRQMWRFKKITAVGEGFGPIYNTCTLIQFRRALSACNLSLSTAFTVLTAKTHLRLTISLLQGLILWKVTTSLCLIKLAKVISYVIVQHFLGDHWNVMMPQNLKSIQIHICKKLYIQLACCIYD